MAESSYDCIVVGSGPGGYVAAIRSAQLGKRTAVIERDKVGGRCLNYACIPAKAVLRSADLLAEIREAGEYGLRVSGLEVDFAGVQSRREKVVGTLTSGVGGLFKKNSIDVTEGAGVSRGVERGLKRQGIDVRTGDPITDVKPGKSGVKFTHGDDSGLEVDYMVIAAGRGADVVGLGLDEAGVEFDERGFVQVD